MRPSLTMTVPESSDDILCSVATAIDIARRRPFNEDLNDIVEEAPEIASPDTIISVSVASQLPPHREQTLLPRDIFHPPLNIIFLNFSPSCRSAHTALMLLSDIENVLSESIPACMPSPFLDSSWRRSMHHNNKSINSVDVTARMNSSMTQSHHASPIQHRIPTRRGESSPLPRNG